MDLSTSSTWPEKPEKPGLEPILINLCADLSAWSYLRDFTAVKKTIRDKYGADAQFYENLTTSTEAIVTANSQYICLAICGSESSLDWLVDADFELRAFGDTHVHTGFLRATESSFDALLAIANRYRQLFPNAELVITGHSLGGAVAVMFAALARQRHVDFKINFILTFGQPICGNEEFAKWFDALEISYFRFVNDPDIVPSLPVSFGKNQWRHAGQEKILGLSQGGKAIDASIKLGNLIRYIVILIFNYFGKDPDAKESAKAQFIAAVLKYHHQMRFYLKLISKK
jgi:hypothetical protein